mgnify:CR=1 FL=1
MWILDWQGAQGVAHDDDTQEFLTRSGAAAVSHPPPLASAGPRRHPRGDGAADRHHRQGGHAVGLGDRGDDRRDRDDQAGHQPAYASMGNKHFITKYLSSSDLPKL